MPKLFWKKCKQPLGELSSSQRKEFFSEMAQQALSSLTREPLNEIIPLNQMVDKYLDTPNIIFEEYNKWSKIYEEERKRIWEPVYLLHLSDIQKASKIDREQLIYFSTEIFFLEWLDEVLSSRSLQIYDLILQMRSKLIRNSIWTEDLEQIYKKISFHGLGGSPILETLKLALKEKTKRYEFQVKYDPNIYDNSKKEAEMALNNFYLKGIQFTASDFRALCPF